MNPDKRKSAEAAEKKDLVCELHGIPVRLPSSAKYKKDRYDVKAGPDIEVGTKAVLAIDWRGERLGYYLGVLVDWWEPQHIGWWSADTTLYFVVLKCSNDKIQDRVGRIVSASWPSSGWGAHGLRVSSWREEDFPSAKNS